MQRPLIPIIIADEQDIIGMTRYQKIAFLMQRELDGPPLDSHFTYDFRCGDYGPVSVKLSEHIDQLVDNGFIEKWVQKNSNDTDVVRYTVTEKGTRVLQHAIADGEFKYVVDDVKALIKYYNNIGLWDLLDYVMWEYPVFAKHAEIHTRRPEELPEKSWTRNVEADHLVEVQYKDQQ